MQKSQIVTNQVIKYYISLYTYNSDTLTVHTVPIHLTETFLKSLFKIS